MPVGVVYHLVRLAMDVRNAWVASGVTASAEGFSFFNRVSIPDTLTGLDREAMMAHEWAHVRHGHTMDIPAAACGTCLQLVQPALSGRVARIAARGIEHR